MKGSHLLWGHNIFLVGNFILTIGDSWSADRNKKSNIINKHHTLNAKPQVSFHILTNTFPCLL